MKKVLFTLALLAITCPLFADIAEYLPPDGTPPGWVRDGGYDSYDASNIAGAAGSEAGAFTSNGVKSAVVQYYRKGGLEVNVAIFDMGSSANAEAVFNALATGHNVDIDLGQGSVVEPNLIMFYSAHCYVRISCDDSSEEMNQTMAALAMTIDAYLF